MGGSAKGGSSAQSPAGTVSVTPPLLPEIAKMLNELGVEQFEQGLPLLQGGADVATSMLSGKTPMALVPSITSLLEKSNMQHTQQMNQAQEQLVRQKITGTEYQNQLAQQRLAGGQAAAGVPFQVGQPLLETAGLTAFGLPKAGMETTQGAGQVLAGMSDKYTAAKGAGEITGRVIGTAVGAYFGGSQGAQVGGQIGGKAGGSFDPSSKSSEKVQGSINVKPTVGQQ